MRGADALPRPSVSAPKPARRLRAGALVQKMPYRIALIAIRPARVTKIFEAAPR